MSDTAEKKMVKDFVVVTPDTTVKAAEAKLRVRNASYCVIQTSEGEPLALVTDEQLNALGPDKNKVLGVEVANLPAAVPVEPGQLLSDIVTEVSGLLFGSKQIRGLIVLNVGKVVGILSRELIREQALTTFGLRGLNAAQIEGDPLDRAPTYVCRLGDHSEVVVSYDIDNPPKCPTHHSILIRKKN